MRKISVVISSLRPDRLEETIDTTAMHSDLVEVVVASPTPPRPRDFVVHVPVPPPGDPKELSWSQKNNLAVRHAQGEYIVYNNDDLHFHPGWAPAVLEHMEKVTASPYVAAFTMANKGTHGIYTAFGLLYPNLGCIRKSDLEKIGGTLFDERYWLSHNDVDLGLRVWFAGGKVGSCKEVVIDFGCEKPSPVTNPYRAKYFDQDVNTFMSIWFPRYFWKFVFNYHRIRKNFTHRDGVLPLERQNSSALWELIIPYFFVRWMQKLGLKDKPRVHLQKHRIARVVNRRWSHLDYELPYPSKR